jgi:hypothetical protein
MLVSVRELETFLSGQRLAVLFFNKDARSLLRAHRAGIGAFPFSIECIFDPSLAYRPRVRALAASVFDADRIATTADELERLVVEEAFDAAIVFETGYENALQDRLFSWQDCTIASLADVVENCAQDFSVYQKVDPNAEFNARWSKHVVAFLTRYLCGHGIQVLSAYNAPPSEDALSDVNVLSFEEPHAIIPVLREDFAQVPVRFVLGEDWACGKTTFLLNRMQEGASGLAGDFWFRLVSKEAIPTFRMQDIFAIKGVYANQIRLAYERNPGREVYVKYDGRLEEFVFGIPRDRTYLIKDMHHYFRDARFVVVHKTDSPRMRDLVARLMRKFEIGADRIRRVRVSHDGREEELPSI